MKPIAKSLVAFAVVGLMGLCCTPVEAHTEFKKQLQKKYPGTKVSCNACHVNKKPKTVRNDFGKLFEKEFKAAKLNITADFKAVKKDREKKKEFVAKVMIPEFDKALKKIKEMENKQKEKYDDLIKAGKLEGIKLDEKKDSK